MAIEVVLDIFSGRPNPRQILDSGQEAEFLSRLKELQFAPEAAVPKPPILGYRGFIVQPSTNSNLDGTVKVYAGIVERTGETYQDRDRSLEGWLLDAIGSNLAEKLVEMVSKEIRQT